MISRITTQMTAQTTLDELNASFNRLSATQAELSSGKKISQASDDPYGMGQVLSLQGQLGALTTYGKNVTDATGYTQTSATALSDITNMVQRVRELVVSSANGTNTQSDLSGAAAEVSQLIDAIKSEANTQYNGQYVFSGTSNTEPYTTAGGDVYQGNSGSAGAVTRQIGPNTSIQINTDLSSVLGSGQNGSGGADGKLLDTLRTIYGDMTSGSTSALGSTDLTNLDTNFNALTQLSTSQGAIGDRLQLAQSRISSFNLTDTQLLSNTQDADMAQTEIDYSTEQAGYQAALKAGANIVQSSLMDFLSSTG
jgi:flagellar hook-associated protein 3 FlgL